MGAWVIGRNVAGYLPETDSHAYAEHGDAYEAFKDMAREYADEDDAANDEHAEPDWADDDYGTMRATVDSILSDGDHLDAHAASLGMETGSAGMTVADSQGRRIEFWLEWNENEVPDDQD